MRGVCGPCMNEVTSLRLFQSLFITITWTPLYGRNAAHQSVHGDETGCARPTSTEPNVTANASNIALYMPRLQTLRNQTTGTLRMRLSPFTFHRLPEVDKTTLRCHRHPGVDRARVRPQLRAMSMRALAVPLRLL